MVKVDPYWPVKIFRGSQVQEVYFESASSSRRLSPDVAAFNKQAADQISINPADWKKQDAEKLSKLLGQNYWPSGETSEDTQTKLSGE